MDAYAAEAAGARAEFRPSWVGVPLKAALALMSEMETAI